MLPAAEKLPPAAAEGQERERERESRRRKGGTITELQNKWHNLPTKKTKGADTGTASPLSPRGHRGHAEPATAPETDRNGLLPTTRQAERANSEGDRPAKRKAAPEAPARGALASVPIVTRHGVVKTPFHDANRGGAF